MFVCLGALRSLVLQGATRLIIEVRSFLDVKKAALGGLVNLLNFLI
tara:strand:+ start:31274 stop:31411 length:138 start_codon:yes stop_codon:yes gene_type:complete